MKSPAETRRIEASGTTVICGHDDPQWGTPGPTSMTDGRQRAFGVEGADVGLGLRPKNIGARVKRVEDART